MTYTPSESKKICSSSIEKIRKICTTKSNPAVKGDDLKTVNQIKRVLDVIDMILENTAKVEKKKYKKRKVSVPAHVRGLDKGVEVTDKLD